MRPLAERAAPHAWPRRRALLPAAVLGLAGLVPGGPCEPSRAHRASADGAQEANETDERLAAWPEPADERALARELERLRKARTETMGTEAHAALVAEGAACAPALLRALEREKDAAARGRIVAVLDLVTDARHTRLVARELASERAEVRRWALARLEPFPDAGVRAPAEAALVRARAAAAPDPKTGAIDPEAAAELLTTALVVTAASSLEGLDVLAEAAAGGWRDLAARARPALERVRGPEATARLAPALDGPRAEAVAALRLLAGCGEKSAVARVRPHLDATDRDLQLAAINALRGIVDDAPPLETLPVFEMIERAKAWKQRL